MYNICHQNTWIFSCHVVRGSKDELASCNPMIYFFQPSRITEVTLVMSGDSYSGGYDLSVKICKNMTCCNVAIGDTVPGATYPNRNACRDIYLEDHPTFTVRTGFICHHGMYNEWICIFFRFKSYLRMTINSNLAMSLSKQKMQEHSLPISLVMLPTEQQQ